MSQIKRKSGGVQRSRKWLNQCLLLLLALVTVSACNSTAPNQNQPINPQTDISNCRGVQHALGETCVPINPQRVIVLAGGLDTVLSLGVKPIGSTHIDTNRWYYLEDRLEGIESLGNPRSPNLEAITALKPDLILGFEATDKENYVLLSQIAPTVIAEIQGSGDWKKMLNKYAEALGKTEKAKQIMTDYQARIEEFQTQMGDRLSQTEVSILHVEPQLEIYLEDSFPATVVADAGLPRPSDQTSTESTFTMNISKELLHKADGDIIFVWTSGRNEDLTEDVQAALEELKADPLWSQLNAVQQGQVYDVPGYWLGMGPISANLVLGDLFKYLVDSPSQVPQ
ncbi:MAG: iron-siderophore ABC transporter substrate-binding protein [Leptolyngbya sp. SIO1E4]|nr:iron-siderophore ABC transporter substrate-binding protein [Leptolyngbya sp. SIO1E4]